MKNEALTRQVFHVIKRLYDYGVREVVIAPGSRSTPLAMAFEVHSELKTYIHPDERGAAFFALGLIKATERPVAVICTSGTAASNFTPAVSEAFISGLPLIILTGDRPHELRNVGAPQAIDQVRMFSNFIKFEIDFPIADLFESPHDLIEATFLQASHYFTGSDRGPVHFNLPFREPLIPDLDAVELLQAEPVTSFDVGQSVDLSGLKTLIQKGNGIMVVGDCQHQSLGSILQAAEHYRLPIIADILSHLRQHEHHHIIRTGDTLFKCQPDIAADFIIRVGKPVVSKQLNQWLAKQKCPQILVQEKSEPDTFPVVPDYHFNMKPAAFFSSMLNMDVEVHNSLVDLFKQYDDCLTEVIDAHVESVDDEGTVVARLLEQIPEDEIVFFGNSMPIRDGDTFMIHSRARVFCNRGANGIDGVVSTALGMAAHSMVNLFIGDISMYHDMNGLIMHKLERFNIRFIVLNNNGGGIFSYLPQKKEEQLFERLYGTPLNLDFSHAAALYELDYTSAAQSDEITLPESTHALYEVITDREENYQAHQSLYRKAKVALGALSADS
ncbi:2-succinyl-5-enolpyruvyl-6-hydroxy-3-cyclohexene-1-carboxylic-acid synthase [Macrococcus hajekii]|uniref:2-succinyl-5-enolpyruvyl-6-hydroxy-3-cyclohexene-1-carboxylate synthase n=1 Tax=Macrococcus hajekii TaxID=198482 RepID=A0A4R6BLU2_9STAP|nr:2-succinyl-5-enolpyruvyl-6-hydroxy-3-cyclohexene-1-carboxylic-acid synthase [Macrococcus hajekii]TDM02597.1 2-succinyl-5-enolpyruvyl-6-hydroxy-3-cyclohexene-1-carboxylic-acid synthase [Macrococcus hajekii]GGB02270.1 2-succinyl-5-enolpyruvyl-6-hydroxy-3-cyclohexene-1-carboxylate synthase [Macrococcus hajekii]